MAVQQTTYATPRADLGVAFEEYSASREQFVASSILAPLEVPKEAATISVITRESLLKDAGAAERESGAYARIAMYAEDKEYRCKEYGYESELGDKQRRRYKSDFDAELAVSQHLWFKLLLRREMRAAALVFNTTTWTGAALYTDNKATPWSTAASDAIGHVIAAKEKVRLGVGIEPDTLLIGGAALANLLNNTGIRAQFPGNAKITLSMIRSALASIFGLTKLVVGGQIYDSAKEGQTFVGAEVWDAKYAMVAVTADAGQAMTEPCIGRTLMWAEDAADLTVTESYREEQARGEIYRVRQNVQEKIFDAPFAHLMRIET